VDIFNPSFGCVSPSFAYVGSTITFTGSNFIPGSQTCSAAKIGSTPTSGIDAASCAIVSSTEVTVVVGSGTALGAAGIHLAISNPSSVNFTSANNLLTVVGNPAFGSVSPPFAYVGSIVTVTGSNFIPGSQTCTAAKIGSTPASGIDAASCAIVSSTEITVVVGSGTALGAAGIYVAMSNPSSVTFSSTNDVLAVTSSECSGAWSTATLSLGRGLFAATSLLAQGLAIFAGGQIGGMLFLF
jgi:hypothetical protein